MLAVVWLWLSGEGLLPVAVPGEPRVGRVMSWMPCDRACCCFCSSLSSWAWAWAVSWLNNGYWASCCSSVSDSTGMTWGEKYGGANNINPVCRPYLPHNPQLLSRTLIIPLTDHWNEPTLHGNNLSDGRNCPAQISLTCAMLMGEARVGESCWGDCWRVRSEVRVRGTTGGCRRCAVTVMVVWEEVGIPTK